MKKILMLTFSLFLFVVLLSHCAREGSESSRDEELRLLRATINEYYKDAQELQEGLWLVEDARKHNGEAAKDGLYVTFDYRSWKLPISNSLVIQTTDSTDAKLLGAFSPSTHYAPYFLLDTITMQPALYRAINTMSVGDTATFLSASWLAYGAGGASSSVSNTPILFRVILKGIEHDPKQRELTWVNQYRDKYPNFVVPSDAEGNPLHGIYVNYIDTVPITDSTSYPETGNVLKLKYAGYYLEDNFLLDANRSEVAILYKWDTSASTYKNYYTHTFTKEISGNYSIKAFDIALRNVATNSWVEFIFTSDYGYGASGNLSNSARPVYPYTPLRFRVHLSSIE
ncbi:MAG: hypothetical protein ACRCSB_06270 [Bacteroidales bacterium]